MRIVLKLIILASFCLVLASNQSRAADINLAYFMGLVEEVDHEQVSDYIDEFFQNHKSTQELLERSILYFPAIEKELGSQGMPQALKILPLIESRCDPLAKSRVGAEGLWQFMVPTARQLGLRINADLDERRDPAKATKAALSYLQYLHEKYEDWTLALAAYNAGPGRVNKAIRLAGGQKNFEAIKSFLPKETRNYIPKYVALQYVVEHHREHGLNPELPELDIHMIGHVTINRKISVAKISEVTNIDQETIAFLNPALKQNYVPALAQGYDLILPQRVMAIFEYYLVTKELMINPFAYRTMELTVDKKQSIYKLATNLNLDPYLLKWWNGLRQEYVEPGQVLRIHELINPNQLLQGSLEPDVFKTVEQLAPLPSKLDYRQTFRKVYLNLLITQGEEMNWDMHQAITL